MLTGHRILAGLHSSSENKVFYTLEWGPCALLLRGTQEGRVVHGKVQHARIEVFCTAP